MGLKRVKVTDMSRKWDLTPRQSIEAECRLRGTDVLVNGCIDILNGTRVDRRLLVVLAGPAAGSVIDGAEGGLTGYWPRVWALRGLLYGWSDGAVPALLGACTDSSWRVREMAAKVAENHIVGAAFDDVVQLRSDPTPRVRAAAERAIAVLVEPGA